MLEDFKKFIFQGNVLDLAIAVVIGVAFKAVIDSLVKNIVLQLIAGLFGKADFSDAMVVSSGTKVYLRIGAFLTDVVSFLVIAGALFVIVKTYETLQARRGKMRVEAATPSDEVVLLTEIRDRLQPRP